MRWGLALAKASNFGSRRKSRAGNQSGSPSFSTSSAAADQSIDADDRFAVGADIILANGPVDERLFSGIMKASTEEKEVRNNTVVLCLVTYGGLAADAYRIGRWLHQRYDDVVVFVPSLCKSAGTLIACAANSIVMTPFGELGPLDVQILKRDELFERRSGLIKNYALEELEQISFRLFEYFMLNIKQGSTIKLKLSRKS